MGAKRRKQDKQDTGKRRRDWGTSFLAELTKCGNVSAACKQARIARSAAYTRYRVDTKFAGEWDTAIETACDDLEAEAWRRAVAGIERPIFQGGKQVGSVQEYSDALLMFLLRGHRPQRFRDRLQVDTYRLTEEDAQLLTDDELRRISRDEMTQVELMAIVASRRQQVTAERTSPGLRQ